MGFKSMDENERFNAFKELADFRLARQFSRTGTEWKISLALWALLVIAPSRVDYNVNSCVLAIFLVLIVIGYSELWARPISERNRDDHDIAFYYMESAEKLLDPLVEIRKKPDRRKYTPMSGWGRFLSEVGTGENWGAAFQILATAFFALVCFMLFASKP